MSGYNATIITRARQMQRQNIRLSEIAERLDVPMNALDECLWRAIDHGSAEKSANQKLGLMRGDAA